MRCQPARIDSASATSTVAFTVATRERMSVYKRLGGTRMALLILLHPIRVGRMLLQGVIEWLREEWERARGEWVGRVTHAEGIFPLLRMFTNVVGTPRATSSPNSGPSPVRQST